MFSGKITARTGRNIIKDLEALPRSFHKVHTPMLVVQGGDDAVVSEALVLRFVENSTVTDKKLIYVKEMRHFVSCEPNVNELIEEMVLWANERV